MPADPRAEAGRAVADPPTAIAPSAPSPPVLSHPAPGPVTAADDDLLTLAAPDLADRLGATGAKLLVIGRTRDGRPFRPSDWAERLGGVLAQYRPRGPGRMRSQAHLGYSPFAVPTEQQGRKCIIVDPALREVEPLAWAFVLNFARDNGLQTTVC